MHSVHSLMSSQIEWQISSKCQGVYMLLMHYDSTVREWANNMTQMLGPIRSQDWEIAQPVVVQCMSNINPDCILFIASWPFNTPSIHLFSKTFIVDRNIWFGNFK